MRPARPRRVGHADVPPRRLRVRLPDARPGEVFVALRAERDGHEFVADAFARGARVRDRRPRPDRRDGPLVVVDDSPTRCSRSAPPAATGSTRARRRHHRLGGQDVDQGPHRRRGRRRPRVHASAGVVQQRDRAAGHGARRPGRHRGARARDGRALRRQHRRAVRDRAPVDRRHHQHRSRPRRAPRRSRGHRRGEGRAARRAARPTASRCSTRRRPPDPSSGPRSAAPVVDRGHGADADVRIVGRRGSTTGCGPRFRLDSPWGSGRRRARGPRRAPGGERGAGRDGGAAPRRPVRRGGRRARRRRGVGVAHGARSTRPTASSCSTTRTTRARARCWPRSRRSPPLPVAGRRIAVLGEMRELGALQRAEHAAGRRAVADAGVDVLVTVGAATGAARRGRGRDAGGRRRCTAVADAAAARRLVARPGRARRRRAREGESRWSGSSASPRRSLEPGSRLVIAVLIAVSVAFIVSVLGTPFLIRLPARAATSASRSATTARSRTRTRRRPARRRWAASRSSSPRFLGYLVAHIRTEAIKFADTAIALWFLILGHVRRSGSTTTSACAGPGTSGCASGARPAGS